MISRPSNSGTAIWVAASSGDSPSSLSSQAVRGQEGQGCCVSSGGGGELRVREMAAVIADHSDVDGVGVGIDPAEHIPVHGVRRNL